MPPVATPEPTATPSLKTVTVLPTSAVPLNVGVVALVILSVVELPVSEAAIRSGVDGTLGAIVSTTRVRLASGVEGALASARRIV